MEKNYHQSTRVMVQSAYTIFNSFTMFASEFEARNKNLNTNYRTNLEERISAAYDTVGIDKQEEKKGVSININLLLDQIFETFTQLRMDVIFAYRTNPSRYDFLNTQLKFDNLCQKRGRDFIFDSATYFYNGIDAYTAEFIDNGLHPENIAEAKTHITAFISAYKNQDISKNTLVAVTDEQQAILNHIYTEITYICQYAQVIFKKDRSKSELFMFSNIAKRYTIPRRSKKTTEAEPELATAVSVYSTGA